MSATDPGGRWRAGPDGDVPLLVFVCHGPSCSERKSPQVLEELQERLCEEDLQAGVRVCASTCMDRCATGPNLAMAIETELLTGVLPGQLEGVLRRCRRSGAGRGEGEPCRSGLRPAPPSP